MTTRRSSNRRAICIGLCALRITAADACDIRQWDDEIQEAAHRFHVDRRLISAVIQVESNACERLYGKLTTSATGAMGLMQIMPKTWNDHRERLHLGTNPYDPHDNVLAGSAYLHDLMQQFGMLDGLAAYYAGPRSVTGANDNAVLASPATLRYVHDVLALAAGYTAHETAHQWKIAEPSAQLFAIQRARSRRGTKVSDKASSTLFAITHARVRDKTDGGVSEEPVQ